MKDKIIHFTRTFLPNTESFILEQINKNGNFKPIILTHQKEKNDLSKSIPKEITVHSYIDQEKNILKKILAQTCYKLKIISPFEKKYFTEIIEQEEPKLIHAHFGTNARYFIPIIKKTKTPLIVSFYGYDCSKFPKKLFGFGKIYLKTVFQYANKILAVSNDMKNDLTKLGCPAEKIEIYHWGINFEIFKYIENIYLDTNNIKFLSIGRLTPKKGFKTLIKAFHIAKRTLPQAKLIIAGEGKERKNLENLIKKLSLENNVNLVGFIPHQEIPNLIKTCNIYIQPSVKASDGDKEGFPTTLMEVLASGKPIITTQHAGIEEFIKNDIYGLLVEENNIEVLSDEIVRLANDKNLQQKLSANARQLAIDKFDSVKQNEKLAEIYQNIIEYYSAVISTFPSVIPVKTGIHFSFSSILLKLISTFLILILGISFVLTRKSHSINFEKLPYFKKWVSCIEPSPIFFEDNFQKGMGYVTYWNGNYSTNESDKSLENLASTGTEWISLVVTQYQENIDSTEIKPSAGRRTASDADLIHVIEKAHSLGMKVSLKPHIGLNNDPGHWWGEIGKNFTEEDWQIWFKSYRKFLIQYAEIAEKNNVEQFYIGNEIRISSLKEQEWRELATLSKQYFHGKILYSEGWRFIDKITWWDAVDFIGVNAYYPLSKTNVPTIEEMENSLRKKIPELFAISSKYDRQIIFSEIGYQSIDGANKQPSDWKLAKNKNTEIDYQEQADCYTAFINTFWDEPWLAGIYWWYWETKADLRSQQDPKYKVDVPLERNYTPQDKPAENIIRNIKIISNKFTLSPKILYTKFWLKMKTLNSYK